MKGDVQVSRRGSAAAEVMASTGESAEAIGPAEQRFISQGPDIPSHRSQASSATAGLCRWRSHA
ncbi:MAG: hypothetical protein ACYTBJ_15805 [Planctomycetota bacterium]